MCTYVMNFNTQVPGRLGLLVTLHLIVTNVFNSVKAPTKRGFSFIEIWMVGVQIPILIGIFEYGAILAIRKSQHGRKTSLIKVGNQAKVLSSKTPKEIDWTHHEKLMDKWTFVFVLLFIVFFNIIYWSITLDIN